MADDGTQLTLILQGNLRIHDPDGRPLPVSGKGPLTLLATLGMARGMRRSREWLSATIWSRTRKPQNSASLRSALATLRAALGPHAGHLVSDNSYVWLENVVLAEIDPDDRGAFFEDAPTNAGEPFDDWLRQERSAFDERLSRLREQLETAHAGAGRANGFALAAGGGGPAERPARPCVGFLPYVAMPAGTAAAWIAEATMGRMIDCLLMHDFADSFDLHDLNTDQIAAFGGRLPVLHSYVKLSVLLSPHEVHLTVTSRDMRTQRVEVTHSMTLGWDGVSIPMEEICSFAATSVDAIHTRLLDKFARLGAGAEDPEVLLPSAVHQIMALEPCHQERARVALRESGLIARSGAAAGWYCFSYANTVGEGDPDLVADRRADLEDQCSKAISLDPTNAMTMALVAHVRGFVLRDLEEGARLARAARERAPFLALAWDLSAMNALYRGEVSDAYRFAARASQLGRFSPYKPILESSFAIAASVAGHHERALRVGGEILRRRPGYLALMRHMSASLAETGRIEEARRMVGEIRQHDTRFRADTITEPDYPLPSAASVDLIRKGFALTGLLGG